MSKPRARSPLALRIAITLLILGLLGNGILYLKLAGRFTLAPEGILAPIAASYHWLAERVNPPPAPTFTFTPTETTLPTNTPTPFQPLPTDTPTPTPTATPTRTPKPTRTPRPPTNTANPSGLPESAYIRGVIGHAQSYTLDCEARSAVDWAAFYGVKIGLKDFLSNLPSSDNPDKGFVGYYNDPRGQLPPASYGVYAKPVARLLRDYGAEATAIKNLSYEDLQREIAAGRPVIAWVVGNVWAGYAASKYTASDGSVVPVVPYEHTVIVIGYDADYVTVVDGAWVYSRPVNTFLASWKVLGKMAVVAE